MTDTERVWMLPPGRRRPLSRRLDEVATALAAEPLPMPGPDSRAGPWWITPAIGVARIRGGTGGRPTAVYAARAAAATAADRRDLEPCWERAGRRPLPRHRRSRHPGQSRAATAVQVLLSLVLPIGLPYLALVAGGRLGLEVVGPAYAVVLAAIVATTAAIYVESAFALAPERPPPPPTGPLPPATAIVTAYLPNEAATILDTVDAFRKIDYEGPLQVILAYNTPGPMPVETALRTAARDFPPLVLLHVPGSTSKAQNINAALELATGDLTAIFDADHHPAPDVLTRAWRWLAAGYGVVQGHCVIRNGRESWLSRIVAVEFECLYAVNHPGRAKLHGFGIFGGSNGYWRTEVLRRVRMRQRMLTEDIDSSARATLAGVRIASDPALLSFELAPTTVPALTRQRLRWAQGWFQVSRRHLARMLTSPAFGRRQKAGAAFLFGWRELYPWLSVLPLPMTLYLLTHPDPGHRIGWATPMIAFLTLVTAGGGGAQALAGYLLAHPSVRRRRRWFVAYALVAGLPYAGYKDALTRLAQVKEVCGDRRWRITPRGHPGRAR